MQAARDAAKRAYAPYSNFRVGAAVLTERGSLFSGCNVENASYGLTICAERTAIFSAVAQEGGENMRIRALAVVSENSSACAPCGACRQVIFEFGPDAIVIFQGQKGVEEMHISELLPKGFVKKRPINN
ncbi:MAG: cytidine deaminase [Nitrospirota bacterium]